MCLDCDCNEIPDWVCWVAQDADGAWWGYEVEPNQSYDGWYENEIGRSAHLGKSSSNTQWVITLIRINH